MKSRTTVGPPRSPMYDAGEEHAKLLVERQQANKQFELDGDGKPFKLAVDYRPGSSRSQSASNQNVDSS